MKQLINLSQGIDLGHDSAISDYTDFDYNLPEETKPLNQHQGSYKDTICENETLIRETYPNKLLFSLEESATILGVSYDYIRNQAINGLISTKSFGKRRMIHLRELTRLLTNGVSN